MQDAENKVIRTRWVISNKCDDTQPDIRARLVAQEVSTCKSDDCFASTPPLEAKRLLFGRLATQRKLEDGRALEVSVVDVRKAYFNGIPRRKL